MQCSDQTMNVMKLELEAQELRRKLGIEVDKSLAMEREVFNLVRKLEGIISIIFLKKLIYFN